MIDKNQIVEKAIEKFLLLGSKQVTLDELATMLGISKKSIYKHFPSKKELVNTSIEALIASFRKDADQILEMERKPLKTIVLLYDTVFDYLQRFSPPFLCELKKYYPEALVIYNDFRHEFVSATVIPLLKKARQDGSIQSEVDLELFCHLHLQGLHHRLLGPNYLFDRYTKKQLIDYMIVNSLRGISTQ
ncbi:TetR/AcrR family transcriptional regulator [Flagellimonas sp.]|uniref:TetR/AcrR family transcriptional regulator n=1 Tax=Flagellimonas sp. TaxID=2058762 RepID=UPI003BAE5B73